MWQIFEPQIRLTRFVMNFLFIIATIQRKVRFCVKLFDHFLTEYSSVWAETCRVSSHIQLGFFHKISIRNSFWKMSHKRFSLQGSPLSRFAKFCHSFCNFFEFILRWRILKTLTQVVSYVVCIKAMSHILKQNSKKDIRKKCQDVLFSEKQVF